MVYYDTLGRNVLIFAQNSKLVNSDEFFKTYEKDFCDLKIVSGRSSGPNVVFDLCEGEKVNWSVIPWILAACQIKEGDCGQ